MRNTSHILKIGITLTKDYWRQCQRKVKIIEKHLVTINFLPIFAAWGSHTSVKRDIDHGQITDHYTQVKRFFGQFCICIPSR